MCHNTVQYAKQTLTFTKIEAKKIPSKPEQFPSNNKIKFITKPNTVNKFHYKLYSRSPHSNNLYVTFISDQHHRQGSYKFNDTNVAVGT